MSSFELSTLQQFMHCLECELQLTFYIRSWPEGCRRYINNWVRIRTNNKITDLLPGGSVFRDTRLVLVNAITFEGNWRYPFTEGMTTRDRFYRSRARYVNMMHMGCGTHNFRYAYVPSIRSRVVELPYYNSPIAMYIVLPVFSLAYTESRFSWDPNSLGLRYRPVQVSLPRFNVKKSTTMTALLKALGMTDLFEKTRSDLRRIAGSSNNLWVLDVFHQAFINVHEKGTEASAATAVAVCPARRKRATTLQFIANRPFLFFIWDRQTRSLLFNGRFTG